MSIKRIEVQYINERPNIKTKFGVKSAWGIKGTDGSKIDFGFKNPSSLGVAVGQTYDIQVETGKYGDELVKGTIPTNVAPGSTGVVMFGGPAGTDTMLFDGPGMLGGVGTRLTFPLDPTDPENIDVRKTALEAAVRFWENRAIPATVESDQQQEDVIKTAYAFAAFITGQRELKAFEGMASEADAS